MAKVLLELIAIISMNENLQKNNRQQFEDII